MKKTTNLVLKEEFLIENIKKDKNAKLHIAFGLDANFGMSMGILVHSILKHNPSLPIFFHIFTNSLREKDMHRLKEIIENNSVNIKIYYMNTNFFKTLPTKFVLPSAIYYRFVMAEILYEKVDYLLYMDVDILCINSLSDLISINLNDNFIGAIEDLDGMAEKARKRNFGFKDTHYFNSGVMYINTKEWKKFDIGRKAMELCSNTRFRQPAQDVFNLLFQNKIYWMNRKYNLVYNLNFMQNSPPPDTVLIHFAGNSKPWQLWGQAHFLTDLYHKYQQETPWKNAPLIFPNAYKHARFMAQYYARKHEKMQSYIWTIKYIFWKLKEKLFK